MLHVRQLTQTEDDMTALSGKNAIIYGGAGGIGAGALAALLLK